MISIHSPQIRSKTVAGLLLAIVAALLLAPFGVTGANAASLSGRAYNVSGDDSEDQANQRPITRGELAKRVSNAAHFNDDPGPQVFQDVPPTHRYYKYVNRLANRGVIGGYSCGTMPEEPCVPPDNLPYYRPDVDALRGQAAKMVSNAAGFNDDPSGQTFQDIPPGSAFYLWVQRLASREIVQGFRCGTRLDEPCVPPDNRPYYRPYETLTKKDAKNMIRKAFQNEGEDSDADPSVKP